MMRKGQMSINTLIMIVILLIVYLAFLPVINEAISSAIDSGSMDPATTLIVQMIPFMLAIMIIATITLYGRAQYQRE